MNSIAIVLIIFLLLSKKDGKYQQILNNLSPTDIQAILDYLGLNENIKSAVTNILPSLLNESLDIKNIFKSLLPLLIGAISENKSKESMINPPPNTLNELDGIANEEIKQSLKNYFI